MWWSSGTAAALGLVLVACGFQPLYGEREHGGDTQAALADVRVAPIPDRLGQVIRNHLLDILTPRGTPTEARYRLTVRLRKAKEGLAFEQDESVTRFDVTIAADYELAEIASGETVAKGTARSIASYNVVRSDFANTAAERDAELRLARELSDEIALRLAVALGRGFARDP
jgi:LPS-assembly lipoprotein